MQPRVARRDGASPEISLTASRALRVLCAFDDAAPELGVSEIARRLGLSRTVVQRLLHKLEAHRFLEQDQDSRRYRVGVQAFRVGNLFAPGRRFEEAARPEMDALAGRTGFTVYLSVLRGDDMVMTAAVEGRGPIRYYARVGQSLPLHSSATGKVALAQLGTARAAELLARTGMRRMTAQTVTDRRALLAQLAEVRARGHSVNWEENTAGVASIAAPILDARGDLHAVLTRWSARARRNCAPSAAMATTTAPTSRACPRSRTSCARRSVASGRSTSSSTTR